MPGFAQKCTANRLNDFCIASASFSIVDSFKFACCKVRCYKDVFFSIKVVKYVIACRHSLDY